MSTMMTLPTIFGIIEADKEQGPLCSIHQDWLTQGELTVREERSNSSEVMMMNQRIDQSVQPLESNT